MAKKKSPKVKKVHGEIVNSYSSFAEGLMTSTYLGGSQLSQAGTLFENNRWYLISNYRQLLSELYGEHGIIQTLVDQPVDDAFRSGFVIKTGQLDAEEIEKLEHYLERFRIIEEIKYGCKWARLYGGGAIIPITDQDPAKPLNIKAINENTPLIFKAVDLWELYYTYAFQQADLDAKSYAADDMINDHYDYYGRQVHKSRVFRIEGKRPPAFLRPRLRGWGMSECEKIVRPLNQYLKNQNVVFELLDEAKVDVYKIDGLNSALAHKNGTQAITARVQTANMIKNYLNALTMDVKDDYQQKQITFSGLAEVLVQIRQDIASSLKMPITKVFGTSTGGLGSGEDEIENYNAMIESEIRAKVKGTVIEVLEICCAKLFGMVPDDLMISFNPLRILNAKEEEEVKTSQYNRVISGYQSGLITPQEAKESINKNSLLPVEVDEAADALPPIGGDFTTSSQSGVVD